MPSFHFTPDEMCTTLKLEMKRIQDFFLANGWDLEPDPRKADIILATTCSGWEGLERNSLATLASLQDCPGRVVSVGCVNEVNPDAVSQVHSGPRLSTRSLEDVETLIDNPSVPLADIPFPSTFRCKEDYRLYDLSKRYVNICMGCSFACSYCPHRIGLGKLRSRTPESILGQIQDLLDQDVRIVVLTGMETALYGRDLDTTYPELLRAVLDLGPGFDIHVAQFHPIGVQRYHEELLELFANERVTDIQIPIQSSSERLLKMMNRPPLPERLGEFLAGVRAANPKAIVRTDLIVGFPTETMGELDASLEFATQHFDEVAAYAIELRKGLPAEKYLGETFPREELDQRVAHAVVFVESKGLIAHGGQQSGESLLELEERKQAMRRAKGHFQEPACAGCAS